MNMEIVIIGAGPAGVTAAVQLKRAGRKVAIFEANKVGGLLHSASLIENFPAFPNGIRGPELANLLEKQLTALDIKPVYQYVTKVSWYDNYFLLETPSGKIKTKYLIAASGTLPKPAPIKVPPSAADYVHSEITSLLATLFYARRTTRHYCVGGQAHDARRVVIIGGGDAAFDYALNLAPHNKVTVVCRSAPKCLSLLLERAKSNPNIDIIDDTVLKQIEPMLRRGSEVRGHPGGERYNWQIKCARRGRGAFCVPQYAKRRRSPDLTSPKADGLKLTFKKEQKNYTIFADHLLFAIGRDPNLDYLKSGLTDSQIKVLTEAKRLFLVGDVGNGLLRQSAIAAGDGMRAAMIISCQLLVEARSKKQEAR